MKRFRTKAIAMMTASLMLFSLVPSKQTFAESSVNVTDSIQWTGRAFGQSTDLNFKSTIAEDKIGTQNAIEKTIKVKTGDQVSEVEAVELESRGGKIANTHDGLTFYYAQVPTSKNFKLTAKVFLNQLGPEASTGAKPSKQEACGLMVRDCVGQARKEPMEFGYEELPAASNIVANMITSPEKKSGCSVITNIYDRNGVTVPYGNTGAKKTQTKVATLSSDIVTTEDRTPADGVYDSNSFFTLTLERNDTGFVVTYTDQEGNTSSKSVGGADRVAVIDKDYMYVGFFASRNAKMTVIDQSLELSDADTKPEGFTADPYAATFDVASAKTSSTSDYTVRLRSNYSGKVTIKQDGTEIATNENADAATFYEKKTTLTKDTTNFEVSYVTDDTNNSVKTASFTVTKNEALGNKDLYVSEDGKADAEGTLENPIDLKTALNYVSDGHTVYVKGGTYDALVMDESYTADAAKRKTLCAYNNEKVVMSGTSQVDASNWNIKQIEFTGSSTTGFRLTGHSNTIELCKFYNNGDTGCQISGGSGTDPLNWPTNNTILNCESYNNVDSSRINADGFAAKLGVGEGNLYKGCVSHNNADDGWDLYNKIEDGANCPVTIENCVAYENGMPLEGEQAVVGSIGNGFKLGGEGLPVDHVVKNCISYNNNMDGFTCNFNPGKITVTNCTSFDNARANYIFRSNPYRTAKEQGVFTNSISFRTNEQFETNDYISGTPVNSYFFNKGNDTVKAEDFASLTVPTTWERDNNGNLVYGDFLRLTKTSDLSANGSYVGALSPKFTITLDANGGTCEKDQLVNSSDNKVTELPTATKANYTFKGWYTAKTGGTKVTADTLSLADQTLYAQFTGNSYVVTFDANTGSCGTKTIKYTADQANVKLPTATKAGYTFKGWYTAKTGGTKVTSVSNVYKNRTVYAQWTANSYVATLNANTGSCSTKSVKYTANQSKITLPTPKKTGYTFKGWYTKKTGGTKVTASTLAKTFKNTTVYAQWTVNKYTVKLNANGGFIGKTSVKSQSAKVNYNSKYTLKTPKRTGYTFEGWYTKKTGGSKVTKLTVKSNTTLYAHWKKVTVSTSKVTAVKNVKTKKAVVSVKKVSGAKGYEVRYSTKSSLKGAKTIKSKSNSNITIKNLKKNSKYYIQVRAYKYDSNGKKVVGKWSSSKTVTIKK